MKDDQQTSGNARGRDSMADNARAALLGVAIGDAMGMPSQTLTRDEISKAYGTISDFRDAVAGHPVSHGLKAGTITDDTEQSLLLAQHLIAHGGKLDIREWANRLLAWEKETHARGVNDLLGPSTKRAITALLAGAAPAEAGRHGTTNGAAMRIAPIAIATPPEPLAQLVEAVRDASLLTHNTAVAVAAASAVAAVISAGVEGATFEQAVPLALAAANDAEVAERISLALQLAGSTKGLNGAIGIAEKIGTSVAAIETVPMAFAIVRIAQHDPWQAAVISANIGDDTDTIGAISCGMAAACGGLASLPKAARHRITAVNQLDLEPLVRGLLALRMGKL